MLLKTNYKFNSILKYILYIIFIISIKSLTSCKNKKSKGFDRSRVEKKNSGVKINEKNTDLDKNIYHENDNIDNKFAKINFSKNGKQTLNGKVKTKVNISGSNGLDDDDGNNESQVENEDKEDKENKVDYVNPSTVKLNASVKQTNPKIYTCKEFESKEVSTVSNIKLGGVSILPGEYELWINCEYKDRSKRLDELGDNHMKKVFSRQNYPGQIIFEKGDPLMYKVENYPMKKISNPRTTHKEKNMAMRAVMAAKQNGSVLEGNDQYKSVALLTFLQDRKNGIINPYKEVALQINEKGAGYMPYRQKTKNRDSDRNIADDQEDNVPDKEGVFPKNTFLELIKVYVIRVEPGVESKFKVYNGLQEVSMDALMGYKTTLEDENENIQQPGEAKVYVDLVAKYDWIGPLGDIDQTGDYKIENKDKSDQLYLLGGPVKKKVDKKLKNKMIFASKKHCNLKKKKVHEFYYSECDSCDRPIAESFHFWRLIIGGECAGVVPPEPTNKDILRKIFSINKIKSVFKKNEKDDLR